ncbi:hypothetical protein PI95_022685 [Hassallia byssoidea VB512170]|uniref:Uncharacterized protein n=1 Tax=Hassallia byssoidea VB512170 TaxID=1304833 RepID=A0A846HER3_9CYAN|nr:hypothetical protein [Hassalia byssoidea]NEU75289.1 hypothetical protein [Hassalia byssoidea VB512170]
MGNGAGGRGQGAGGRGQGDKGEQGDNYQLPMPIAQCPLPNSQFAKIQ